MRIFKLSLGVAFISQNQFNSLRKSNLVTLHPNTKAKGQSGRSQGEAFLKAEKGDLFYVCRSNESIEFIGMFNDQRPLFSTVQGNKEWVDRSYINLFEAKDKFGYDKDLDKWWTPKNNSTFIEIPKDQMGSFEKEILKAVFKTNLTDLELQQKSVLKKHKLNLNDYSELQQNYSRLSSDRPYLFKAVNNLSIIELKKIYFSYIRRGDISNQPVVLLRKKILENLIKSKKIDKNLILEVKNEINDSFEKNIFHAWKSNFRILYTFLFDKHKQGLELFFNSLIKKLQKDLEIENETKYKLVHFDGPQNQGNDRIWFAIYNKTYKSQKFAKQLFFEIDNGFQCGLLYRQDETKNILKTIENPDFDKIKNIFEEFKYEILKDNSVEKATIEEFIDILEYKKQIILQGSPGTGKTFTAKDLAEQIIRGSISEDKRGQVKFLQQSDQFELIQFHPSYTYEDFVRGIVVESKEGNVAYRTINKSLGEFAEKALENYNLSRKDNTEANIKKWIDEKFEEFKNEIEVEIEEDDVQLSGNVSIFEIGANSFKYGKNWKISSHLNFQEIKKLIKEVLENRLTISNQQIPKDISVHAHYRYTYYNALLSIFFDKFEYKNEETQTDEKKYILIIDEINRANLPSVLGELIYALEYRGQSVSSMYALDNGDNKITIPENLYIIGTMNTADRSVGHIDYAIRRRFAFKEILPKELTNLGDRFKKKQFEEVSKLFVKEIKSKSIELEASEHLSPEFADRPQDVWLGHSYFIEQEDEAGNPIDFNLRIQYEIIPILEEYIKDGILSNTEEVKKIIKDLSN